MTQDEYIVNNRNRRVEDVALELSRRPDLDAPFVLRQIEGWQRMRAKVPRWTEVEGIHFPPRLALEQCSGQPAAEYKAKVAERLLRPAPLFSPERGEEECHASHTTQMAEATASRSKELSIVDLTGGMGVDFSFIAPLFNTRTYVEQREELVVAARHNFPLLGLADARIVHGDGVDFLRALPIMDEDGDGTFIFLDPARRDAHGSKTVLIEDCEPNVAELLPLLRSKARFIMVKLSPMLDLHRAIATLPGISEVHVFASGGECKDLLLVFGPEAPAEPRIFCADEHHSFSFTYSAESTAIPSMASRLVGFLYEPNPAIMKAGAYRTFATHYGLQKLHANSHLYVSPDLVADVPARAFHIDCIYTFAKADLKALASDLKAEGGKANLTVRNFPASVADLRKKLKIKEGGSVYLFATTDCENRKIIIRCSKIRLAND